MTPLRRLPLPGIVLGLALLTVAPATATEPAAGKPARKSTPLRFSLQKGKASQELEVRFLSRKKITFKLTISEPCKRMVAGSATSKGGDAESDEGEDGVSYFVDEYKHTAKGGCYHAIRIDADDKRRARVVEADCKAACAPSDAVMRSAP
jgi:hypothetical protein